MIALGGIHGTGEEGGRGWRPKDRAGRASPARRASPGSGWDAEPGWGNQPRNPSHTPPASAPRNGLAVHGQRNGAGWGPALGAELV